MNERNLYEGQWEDRKQWSLGVGQRKKNVLKPIYIYIYYYYTGCPTRYRTRHFFNNSNTNEVIATEFEQQYILFFHISYTMR